MCSWRVSFSSPCHHLCTFFTRPVPVRNRQKGCARKKSSTPRPVWAREKMHCLAIHCGGGVPLVNRTQFFRNSMGTALLFVWEFRSAWNTFFFQDSNKGAKLLSNWLAKRNNNNQLENFYRLQFLFFPYRFTVPGFPHAIQRYIFFRSAERF